MAAKVNRRRLLEIVDRIEEWLNAQRSARIGGRARYLFGARPPRRIETLGDRFRNSAIESNKASARSARFEKPLRLLIRNIKIALYWRRQSLKEHPGAATDQTLKVIGSVVAVTGVLFVFLIAYSLLFTGLQEHRAQEAMLERYQNQSQQAQLLLGSTPLKGQPIGVLEVPVLRLQDVIVSGATATSMMSGPGWAIGSALIGTKGNAVVEGRRIGASGPFSTLPKVKKGEKVVAITQLGKFTYVVRQVGQVRTGAPSPMRPRSDPSLTLVTSAPPFTPHGLYFVRAALTSAVASAPPISGKISSTQQGLSGDSSAIAPSIEWGIALLSVILTSFLIGKRLRRHQVVVYLLALPVVMMFALLWFENAFRLLPATL